LGQFHRNKSGAKQQHWVFSFLSDKLDHYFPNIDLLHRLPSHIKPDNKANSVSLHEILGHAAEVENNSKQ